ncbi:hypothetical protein [Acidocella sp.]|jgi:hypothetical protein|uniref:hypothetical protein n=1 Tax=Acidocella sp. TaxID=50710 RepID=UPI002F4042B7
MMVQNPGRSPTSTQTAAGAENLKDPERSRTIQKQEKGKAAFCEQKEAKKLYSSGPWAAPATTPMAQHRRNFCATFFKKRPLSSI